jgi:hypothetical protein
MSCSLQLSPAPEHSPEERFPPGGPSFSEAEAAAMLGGEPLRNAISVQEQLWIGRVGHPNQLLLQRRYAGVLAAHARWRPLVVPPPPAETVASPSASDAGHSLPIANKKDPRPPTHRCGYIRWQVLMRQLGSNVAGARHRRSDRLPPARPLATGQAPVCPETRNPFRWPSMASVFCPDPPAPPHLPASIVSSPRYPTRPEGVYFSYGLTS